MTFVWFLMVNMRGFTKSLLNQYFNKLLGQSACLGGNTHKRYSRVVTGGEKNRYLKCGQFEVSIEHPRKLIH